MLKYLLILSLSVFSLVGYGQNKPPMLPDKHGDYLNGIYHVGFWVEEVDEMLEFLAETTDFKIISRVQRRSGGERIFLSDPRGQRLELLSDPANVKAHSEFPLHPRGRIAGVAHLSIEVSDVVSLKDKLTAKGYKVLAQVPGDYTDGYVVSEVDAHRVLFIEGPSAISFEFFEIKK